MGQLRDKSQFYYSMSTMLAAGVSLLNALRQPMPRRFRNFAARAYQAIQTGTAFEEILASAPEFTKFEKAVLRVGQRSGCLPDAMKSLSGWFATQHELRQKIIAGLAYPLFCYHVAGPLLAIIDHFASGESIHNCITYLICWTLAPWVLFLILRIFLPFLRRNPLCGGIIHLLPVLGNLQFSLESATFFQALSMSLDAGMGMPESIRISAEVCANSNYRRRYLRIADLTENTGCRFHEAFQMVQNFREAASPLPSLLITGEESGKLPETCANISKLNQEGAAQQLQLLTKILPGLFYFAVAAYLAYRIINFYACYIGQINSLLN